MSLGFHPFGGRVSKRFGDSLHPDDAYLSYHDVRLTKEDVNCIKNDWLTDNVIAFWEEYLEREKLKDFPQSHINLLRPSMCFMLVQTPDPLTLKDALPSFSRSTHIFLPVNDCTSPNTAEGGSHWSLLLVSILDGVAFHYDSMHASNYNFAAIAAEKLGILLRRPLKFVDLDDTPQQLNGSDCGMFVCLMMKTLLLKKLLLKDSREKVRMNMGGMEIDANKGRKDMLKLIEEFRKQGRRSQSQSQSRSRSRPGSRSRSPPRVGSFSMDAGHR